MDQAHQDIQELKERLINEEKVCKENRKLKEDLDLMEHKLKIYKQQIKEPEEMVGVKTEQTQLEIAKKECEFLNNENFKLAEQIQGLQ